MQEPTRNQETAQEWSGVSTPGVEYSAPTGIGDSKQKYKKVLHGLGISQVVLGGVTILLSIIVLSIAEKEAYIIDALRDPDATYYIYANPRFNYVSEGVWGGAFIVITGILGILANSNPTRCVYVANMVLAIITANAAGVTLIFSGISIAVYSDSLTLFIIYIMITMLVFASFILTITHAAFCCRGVCCKSAHDDTQQLIYVPQSQAISPLQQQYVRGPNGELRLAVHQTN